MRALTYPRSSSRLTPLSSSVSWKNAKSCDVRRPGTTSLAEQIVLAVELLRVLSVLAVVEKSRMELGIEPAVAAMRERGGQSIHRDADRRVQLQRAIGWVDARMSGGANCYRRVLLE